MVERLAREAEALSQYDVSVRLALQEPLMPSLVDKSICATLQELTVQLLHPFGRSTLFLRELPKEERPEWKKRWTAFKQQADYTGVEWFLTKWEAIGRPLKLSVCLIEGSQQK